MNRDNRHCNGTHNTVVPRRYNKQVNYTYEHYPKEHFPITGSLPPLINAGLSLHCSTPFSRNSFIPIIHRSAVPGESREPKVHGRGARPSSPSKLRSHNDTRHVHAEAGAWTSCCQRYQTSTAATNISDVTFGIGFFKPRERTSILAFLLHARSFLNFCITPDCHSNCKKNSRASTPKSQSNPSFI